MKTIDVKLSEATLPQLRQYATEVMGIEISPNSGAPVIRAKIQAAQGEAVETIKLQVDDSAPLQTAAPKSDKAEDEYVSVLITKMEEPGGGDPVYLAVNGVGQYVERGKPQRIRKPYLEVLEHAVKDVYDTDEEGNINPTPRKVPSYPFQVVQSAA